MMFSDLQPPAISGWVCVYRSVSEHEAHLIASYLNDGGIQAEVMNRKDSTYVFSNGMMGEVFVYVETARRIEAETLLNAMEREDTHE